MLQKSPTQQEQELSRGDGAIPALASEGFSQVLQQMHLLAAPAEFRGYAGLDPAA